MLTLIFREPHTLVSPIFQQALPGDCVTAPDSGQQLWGHRFSSRRELYQCLHIFTVSVITFRSDNLHRYKAGEICTCMAYDNSPLSLPTQLPFFCILFAPRHN